jgi:hypothetical protein
LFGLKVSGNSSVGILGELLSYLWVLHRVRVGLPGGRVIGGGGPGVAAARGAERLVGVFGGDAAVLAVCLLIEWS